MIRFIKLVAVSISFFSISIAMAQDITDANHSFVFAQYLFRSQQYSFAAEEFERVLYFNPADTASAVMLLSSYRLASDFETGISRGIGIKESGIKNPRLNSELAKLYLTSGDIDRLTELIGAEDFPVQKLPYWKACTSLLNSNYSEAVRVLESAADSSQSYLKLYSITSSQSLERYKSPFVAASLSVLIPGSGKVYTGDWKDGVVSFLIIGANAFQAYRGFSSQGTRSGYGWFFASTGFVFYTGNIWGSAKAAKVRNKNIKLDRVKQIEDFVLSYL